MWLCRCNIALAFHDSIPLCQSECLINLTVSLTPGHHHQNLGTEKNNLTMTSVSLKIRRTFFSTSKHKRDDSDMWLVVILQKSCRKSLIAPLTHLTTDGAEQINNFSITSSPSRYVFAAVFLNLCLTLVTGPLQAGYVSIRLRRSLCGWEQGIVFKHQRQRAHASHLYMPAKSHCPTGSRCIENHKFVDKKLTGFQHAFNVSVHTTRLYIARRLNLPYMLVRWASADDVRRL